MAVSVLVLSVVAGAILVGYSNDLKRTLTPVTGPTRRRSPLAEAEQILAGRYARGELTREEYDRMLSVLRR